MRSMILSSVLKVLIPLFLAFAIFMLFRGHDRPGGGFIGGLVAAIPFMVHALAFSPQDTQKRYGIKPLFIAPTGLLLAAVSGVFPLLMGKPFLTAMWSANKFPLIGKVGTPTLFDIGVLMIVAGVVLKITFLVLEDDLKKEKTI